MRLRVVQPSQRIFDGLVFNENTGRVVAVESHLPCILHGRAFVVLKAPCDVSLALAKLVS